MKEKLLLLLLLSITCFANAQYVGIGTTTPNAKLSISANGTEITGTAMSSTLRTTAGSLGTTAGSELSLGSIGFLSSNNSVLGIRAYRSSAGTDWTTTALLLEYDVDNTVRASSGFLALSANGNIGIGTFTPNAPLSFPPVLGKKITLYPGATGDVGMAVQGNLFQIYSDNPSADIAFGYDQGGTMTERMRINANGNVGIGTTNPQKNLSVQNGMNIDQADGNTGSIVNAITFGNNSGEGIGSKRNAGGNQWGLDFYTNSTNRMSITNSGNVGIGITNPAAKLQVSAGDASVALFGPNSYSGQLAIGATPINQTSSSTAQVIASDGNLHIDPASGKNIYLGYFQARDIYLDPTGGKVGIGTATPAATLEVNGFSKLGSNAPSIKVIKLTGTTAAAEGGLVQFPHGLTASKILAVSVIVQAAPTLWVGPQYSPGYNFKWSYNTFDFNVQNFSGDSANILSKPFTVFITYEE